MKRTILTLFALMMATASLWAHDFVVDGIYYNFDSSSDKHVIVTYKGTNKTNHNTYSGKISIPENVTYGGSTYAVDSIGDNAFYRCTGLTSITIPNSVTEIGGHAFYNCTGLTEITIPESVTLIDFSAFQDCNNVHTLNFNAVNCQTKASAWYGYNIETLNIGEKVTTLNNYAFSSISPRVINCKAKTPPTISENTFFEETYKGGESLKEAALYVPEESYQAYATTNPWSNFVRINDVTPYTVTIEESTKHKIEVIRSDNGERVYSGEQLPGGTLVNITAVSDRSNLIINGQPIDSPHSLYITEDVTISASSYCYPVVDWSDSSVLTERHLTSIISSGTYAGSIAYTNDTYVTYTLLDETLTVLPGSTFTLTYNAYQGGSDNLQYTRAYIFADWNGDGVFEYDNTQTSPHGELITIVGEMNQGNPQVLSIQQNFTVPEDASIGESCIRIIYSDSWFDLESPCISIKGLICDIPLNILRYSIYTPITEHGSVQILKGDTEILSGSSVNPGTVLTLTATPNEGYFFNRWNDGCLDNPRSVIMTNDTTLVAEFSDQCLLTLRVNDETMGSALGGKKYAPGSTAKIIAYANEGYYFEQWSDGNTDNPRDFVIEAPCILTAQFEKYRVVTLSVNDETMGSVTGSGTEYRKGETVPIEAIPAEGYYFVRWNDGNTEATRLETIKEDITLSAEFERYRVLSATTNEISWGKIEGVGNYKKGVVATVSAVPAEGCYFIQWGDGITSYTRTFTMNEDVNLTAEFGKYCILTLLPNEASMGSIIGGGEYLSNEEATIVAIPNEGYFFSRWGDGNTDNPRQITVVSDTTFTAEFSNKCYLTLRANDESMGMVLGEREYAPGATASIMARANSGYYFVQWNDGNTDNPRKVVMDTPKTLTAEFERYRSVTLSVNDEAMGSVTGAGQYRLNEVATLEAIPAEGYYFVKWSDGHIQTTRTVTTNKDITLTAEFERYRVLSLTPNNSEWGSIEGTGSYKKGVVVTATARPAEGCYFVQWSDGVTAYIHTFTMDEDITLTAEFGKNCVVTLLTNDDRLGSTFGYGEYPSGEMVTLYAFPESGCEFQQWSDGNTENPRILTVTEDLTLTAIFVNPSGVDEIGSTGVQVYTANGVLLIDNAEVGVEVAICDLSGRIIKVCETEAGSTRIALESGIYIVRVASNTVKVVL